LLLL
jgi:hypothetical protein